jgi:DNA-binding PucR family transcriptional regulator
LTTRDAEAARRFVDDELGALLRANDAERMLETLESYFAAGHNGASAAARLGVSSRTVSYRLHAIEEVLGHAIVTRSAELQTALRLHRHLADS